MLLPETQYVKTPGGYVAYQVFGKGELNTSSLPTLEEWMDDAREVLDVVGIDKVPTN